jgi:two-component system, LuxR family, response regulator FixJ
MDLAPTRWNLAIVDDDEHVRVALARLLRCLGHTVRVFAWAEEFEAEVCPVDCVIVDMRLPGRSGLELRERLRDREVPVPVVLITGDTGACAREASASGGIPALTKPFDDLTLTAAIADAISSTISLRESHAH